MESVLLPRPSTTTRKTRVAAALGAFGPAEPCDAGSSRGRGSGKLAGARRPSFLGRGGRSSPRRAGESVQGRAGRSTKGAAVGSRMSAPALESRGATAGGEFGAQSAVGGWGIERSGMRMWVRWAPFFKNFLDLSTHRVYIGWAGCRLGCRLLIYNRF
jgi:hypothetical protein